MVPSSAVTSTRNWVAPGTSVTWWPPSVPFASSSATFSTVLYWTVALLSVAVAATVASPTPLATDAV